MLVFTVSKMFKIISNLFLADQQPSAPSDTGEIGFPEIPGDDLDLPSVPNSTNPGAAPRNSGEDIDFDDLASRFENLKKRK